MYCLAPPSDPVNVKPVLHTFSCLLLLLSFVLFKQFIVLFGIEVFAPIFHVRFHNLQSVVTFPSDCGGWFLHHVDMVSS